MSDAQTEAELKVQQACARGDFEAAATAALGAYGTEMVTFLRARLRSPSDGDEAFAMFAEDMWKGLPGFAFRCSTRTWLYTLARNAANRYATQPQNRGARNQRLSAHGSLDELVVRARTATQLHHRTDVKDKLRELREQLSVEDQTLLLLHIDRGLAWREVALIMNDAGELDESTLERDAARLRKRFERVKVDLRALAKAAGLLKT